ncbi:mariner Mos1 transposase [Trichonephila clavipes]|nr:mariner Mos1 transposase [Trichonephila clavipes]
MKIVNPDDPDQDNGTKFLNCCIDIGPGQLLARQRRKGFLHRIATGDEKWVRYDNPKRRKSWGYPGHASTSTAKSNIHCSKVMLSIGWDQLGAVYCELLKPTETITGDRYRTQLMRLSRALKDKRPQYNERHDKVILQHANAGPHVAKVVKTYLETLKSYPTHCILQTLLPRIITCFDQWHTAWLTNTSGLMKK